MRSPSVQRAYDRYYPILEDGWRFRNGTRLFYEWIKSTPQLSQARVLNVGAGPTPREERRRLRGHAGYLVGVDIDPVVMSNQDLDEAHVTNGVELPFKDATFEAAYSDWTLEHVAEPSRLLREIRRVLKPGAKFFFRTTNNRHYVTLVSAHTPHWFHQVIANRARRLDTAAARPSQTFYRINSPRSVRRALEEADFGRIDIRLIEPDPGYLAFNSYAFRLGVLYERAVNRWEGLSRFRLILVGRAAAGIREFV